MRGLWSISERGRRFRDVLGREGNASKEVSSSTSALLWTVGSGRVCSCSRSLAGHAQTWRLSLDGVRGVKPLRVGEDRAVGDAKVTEDATPSAESTPETNGAVSCLPIQDPRKKCAYLDGIT